MSRFHTAQASVEHEQVVLELHGRLEMLGLKQAGGIPLLLGHLPHKPRCLAGIHDGPKVGQRSHLAARTVFEKLHHGHLAP